MQISKFKAKKTHESMHTSHICRIQAVFFILKILEISRQRRQRVYVGIGRWQRE